MSQTTSCEYAYLLHPESTHAVVQSQEADDGQN